MLSTASARSAIAFGSLALLTSLIVRRRASLVARRFFSNGAPRAEKRPHPVAFGAIEGNSDSMPEEVTRDDPYFWLRDDSRTSEEVLEHLRTENAYMQRATAHLAPLQKRLFEEQKSHLRETDDSVPYPDGAYEYFTRREEGKSYIIVCRKLKGDAGSEEVLLDGNKVAEGSKFCDIENWQPSPDHSMLAYAVDFSGNEAYDIRIVNLQSGEVEDDALTGIAFGEFVWGRDKTEVYYLAMDDAHRPDKLMRHTIGTPQASDTTLFTEPDELHWLGLSRSRSGRFVFASNGCSTTNQIHVVDMHAETPTAVVAHPREPELLYEMTHVGDQFLICHNGDGATEFMLSTCPLDSTNKANWKPLLPYNQDIRLSSISAFRDFVAVSGRQGGLTQIFLLDVQDGVIQPDTWRKIKFDEDLYDVGLSTNEEYETRSLRIEYASLVKPRSVIECDVKSGSLTLLKSFDCPNYNPELYTSKRIEVAARDGTRVPVSMVFRKDTWDGVDRPKEPLPMLLYGYGSYGIPIDPDFRADRLCYLDRGMVFAIAHIRGGGEMGRHWYESGKFLSKKNTFTDFVDCAEHLVGTGVTAPAKLAIEGRSAGGLLMGAVINMAPHLFKACVGGVPFIDLMNTMSDESIPLTVTEYMEWGNPHETKYHDYMLSYSPYDNIKPQRYPAVLSLGGLHDPRVQYWEPAKWVAKLRENQTGDSPILLKIDMSSGHFSASDRYRYISERSVDIAFVLWQLGLDK